MRPLNCRFFVSSSTTMLVTAPLRICMIVLPRATMWTWFQSLTLISAFNSSAVCCRLPMTTGFPPSGT